MSNILFIAAAGAAGVLLRYFLSVGIDQRFSAVFPWGTLTVNLVGCFIAGFLFHVLVGQIPASLQLADQRLRNAVMVGFLGGFTTFSAYSLQTLALYQAGQWQWATLNVVISNVGGLALTWAGYTLSRSMVEFEI